MGKAVTDPGLMLLKAEGWECEVTSLRTRFPAMMVLAMRAGFHRVGLLRHGGSGTNTPPPARKMFFDHGAAHRLKEQIS